MSTSRVGFSLSLSLSLSLFSSLYHRISNNGGNAESNFESYCRSGHFGPSCCRVRCTQAPGFECGLGMNRFSLLHDSLMFFLFRSSFLSVCSLYFTVLLRRGGAALVNLLLPLFCLDEAEPYIVVPDSTSGPDCQSRIHCGVLPYHHCMYVFFAAVVWMDVRWATGLFLCVAVCLLFSLAENKPPFSWLRQVYEIFNRKYGCNISFSVTTR